MHCCAERYVHFAFGTCKISRRRHNFMHAAVGRTLGGRRAAAGKFSDVQLLYIYIYIYII